PRRTRQQPKHQQHHASGYNSASQHVQGKSGMDHGVGHPSNSCPRWKHLHTALERAAAGPRREMRGPMLLRITQTTEGPTTVLRTDGQLVRDGVAELARLVQAAAPPLALDLTDLRQVDAAGIALLQALVEAGTRVRGVSPYIALLLERPPP